LSPPGRRRGLPPPPSRPCLHLPPACGLICAAPVHICLRGSRPPRSPSRRSGRCPSIVAETVQIRGRPRGSLLLPVRRRGSSPFPPLPRADLGGPAPSCLCRGCLCRGRLWADPAPSCLCCWPPLFAVHTFLLRPAAISSIPGSRRPSSAPACCARLSSSAVVRLLHATNSHCRGEDLCNCHRPDNDTANSLRIRICAVVCCALPRRHLRRAPVAAIAGRLSNSSSATRTSVNSSNSGCCQLRFLWFVWFPVSCSSQFS
jgi:hypothetical protein